VFVPQTERAVGNTPLKPVIGSNYETGLKGELLDGRVNASIALFRYDQENRAVTDVASGFACDDWYCSTAAGKVRSQGVEAEISGEVLSGLQLFAGYTYNTTKFLDDPDEKGPTFSQWTPKHMLRAWADYTLPLDGQRWSTGLGFTTQSHTLGYERTYTVPGYTVWSARLAYQLTPEVNLAVNANNLFDKKYWVAGFNQLNGSNNYGEPRNADPGSVCQRPLRQGPVGALARLVEREMASREVELRRAAGLGWLPAVIPGQGQVWPILTVGRLHPQRQQCLLQAVHQLQQGWRCLLWLQHQRAGPLPHLQAVKQKPRCHGRQRQLIDCRTDRRHLGSIYIAEEQQRDVEVGRRHRFAAAQAQPTPPLGQGPALGIADRQGEKQPFERATAGAYILNHTNSMT